MNEATWTSAASAGRFLPNSASADQKWAAILSALLLVVLLYNVTALSIGNWNPWRLVTSIRTRRAAGNDQVAATGQTPTSADRLAAAGPGTVA